MDLRIWIPFLENCQVRSGEVSDVEWRDSSTKRADWKMSLSGATESHAEPTQAELVEAGFDKLSLRKFKHVLPADDN
jgi:hypothetical protein